MSVRAMSSAGNTRGLIEAALRRRRNRPRGCLPRGIPAASLKQDRPRRVVPRLRRLPRGIPAASLKRWTPTSRNGVLPQSSAGNTRGLIEAFGAAIAKIGIGTRLPRGIPAASLKLVVVLAVVRRHDVFRGEYPRPH